MTNQQILEKAIQKAIDGGWHTEAMDFYDNDERVLIYYSQTEDPRLYIYNHDFAKALWDRPIPGYSNVYTTYEVNEKDVPEWQFRLMEMVIANDPIKYLGDNI